MDLSQEGGEVLDLLGDLPAVGIGHGLVVVDDLRGVQEGQCHLLAIVLAAEQQTCGEVVYIVVGTGNVGVQILIQAAVAVGGNVVGIGNCHGRQTGTGCMSGNQCLVDVLIGADILGLHGDQLLGSVELLDHVCHQLIVLGFQSMPPCNGDRLGHLVLTGVCGLRRCRSCCAGSVGACLAGGATAGAGGQSCCGCKGTGSHQEAATRNLFHDRSFFHLCFLKAHGRASRYADS